MEEQNKAKEVSMNNNLGSKTLNSKTEAKKLTYEQLNDACNQLWQQNKQLVARSRELEQVVMNKRLEYLFKVLELSNMFTSDFVVSCSNEIEEAMTIPQSKEEKNN